MKLFDYGKRKLFHVVFLYVIAFNIILLLCYVVGNIKTISVFARDLG